MRNFTLMIDTIWIWNTYRFVFTVEKYIYNCGTQVTDTYTEHTTDCSAKMYKGVGRGNTLPSTIILYGVCHMVCCVFFIFSLVFSLVAGCKCDCWLCHTVNSNSNVRNPHPPSPIPQPTIKFHKK